MPGLQQHAERHHHHEVLLVLALDLPHRRRHQHHAGVAVETLMMRQADVEILLLLLAVLVLADGRRLLAQLHPGALRARRRARPSPPAHPSAPARRRRCLLGRRAPAAARRPRRSGRRRPAPTPSATAPHGRMRPAACELQCAMCHRALDLSLRGRPCQPRAPKMIGSAPHRACSALMAGMRQSRDEPHAGNEEMSVLTDGARCRTRHAALRQRPAMQSASMC